MFVDGDAPGVTQGIGAGAGEPTSSRAGIHDPQLGTPQKPAPARRSPLQCPTPRAWTIRLDLDATLPTTQDLSKIRRWL